MSGTHATTPPSLRSHRILVAAGTRPEAIKLAPVIHALRERPWANVRVLATAQHRHLLDHVNAFFGIVPDRDLDLMREDQPLADLTARLLAGIDPVIADERPDLVLAQGDTTTVMATALVCFYRNVAFGHVEAGLRTGDLRRPFPEELNRVLADRIAALHFAPTQAAALHLQDEGVPAASVHVTGNTAIDALQWTSARVDPARFAPPAGRRLVLATAHRRENFGAPFADICRALRSIADRGDVQVLYALHPNPGVLDAARRELGDHAAIRLTAPLDYPDMVAAMRASHLILTDSGGVQEEAPSLGKPVLVLRDVTERPEGVAAGAARLVGTDHRNIVAAANQLLDDERSYAAMAKVIHPYGDGHAAGRIADAIERFLAR